MRTKPPRLSPVIEYFRHLIRLLTTTDLSTRDISAAVGVSKTTVNRYDQLLSQRTETWEELSALPRNELRALFNPPRASNKVHPDFAEFDKRLSEPGMTLYRLWNRFARAVGADAIGYDQCARLYRQRNIDQSLVLRRAYAPGYVAFVDFSGKRPHYLDRKTGKKVFVELFVAVLGASSYTFVCCTPTQAVPDWITAQSRMLAFFGGSPKTIVPDNLKAAVTQVGAEPTIQRHYLEFGTHHNIAVLPARPGKPRDKGLVEQAVGFVQRSMLPELAEQTFHSFEEVDAAVAALLPAYNAQPFDKREGSRRSQFEAIERDALQPLPAIPFALHHWISGVKVPPDYHVAVQGHHYSVPHPLAGKEVNVCVTGNTVEFLHEDICVARHARSMFKDRITTDPAHQPDAHRAQAERTPEHLKAWAVTVGPHTSAVMAEIFDRKLPLQGLPSGIALRNLSRASTPKEIEAAAGRAIAMHTPTATAVRRELKSVGAEEVASPPASRRRGRAAPQLSTPKIASTRSRHRRPRKAASQSGRIAV